MKYKFEGLNGTINNWPIGQDLADGSIVEINEKEIRQPGVVWFAKQGLYGYGDPTEPNLYPHAFVKFIEYRRYVRLAQEAEALRDQAEVAQRGLAAKGFGNAALDDALARFETFKKEGR